ncbi:hypothetical protein ACC757_23680 [Rhizobium ruizarguesonis]
MIDEQTRCVTITATIYRDLAAREVSEGVRLFTGLIGQAIRYLARMMSIDTARWHLSEMSAHYHDFGGGQVRAHPAELDGHDILTALHDRLDMIHDENDRQEIRRLYLQSVTVHKYSPADLTTLTDLLARYIPAFSAAIAPKHRIEAWEIEEMLYQRLENGDLCASSRVRGLCDPSFDREQYIEIEMRGDNILVKCPDPAVDAKFGEYQRSLREAGATDAITSGDGLFDLVSMEPRTVNGVLMAHDAQRFPPHPSVASVLIGIARFSKSIVDPAIRLLALEDNRDFAQNYAPSGPAAPGMNGR